MRATEKFYIAYGSNLNVPQMKTRCLGACIIGQATLEGWELAFRGRPGYAYLTIEEKPGSSVPVVIWRVTSRNEEALDWYEGFPSFYYKKGFTVTCWDRRVGKKRTVDAFAYIMTDGHPLALPSSGYMHTCLDGYESFGFDKHILLAAYNKSEEVFRD